MSSADGGPPRHSRGGIQEGDSPDLGSKGGQRLDRLAGEHPI